MAPHRRIILDRSDFEVLQRLVETHTTGPLAPQAELLDLELGLAEVHDCVPRDVVTMNSTVVFEDEATGERHRKTLCFPHQVREGGERVSVLAPVGSALLGLSVGESIEWPVPGGVRRLRVVELPHQPQRTQDLTSHALPRGFADALAELPAPPLLLDRRTDRQHRRRQP